MVVRGTDGCVEARVLVWRDGLELVLDVAHMFDYYNY